MDVLNPQLKQLLELLKDGQTYSRTTSTKSFSVRRFYLDEKRTRASREGNLFDESFMGVWVVGSNKKRFSLTMYVNDNNNASDGIPLRSNMAIPFTIPQAGATFEWEPQEGVWVDVLFSHQSPISVGSIEQDLKGVMVTSDGSNYDHSGLSIGSSPIEVFPVNDNRGVSTLFNYSNEVIFLGKSEKLLESNFKVNSIRLYPNDFFSWRNSSSLFARTDLAPAEEIVILNEGV